ncbi:ketoacyl-ACP synthase III [Leptospira sp. 201903071]|uniref:3-oxoacyl-ACP synthase III family protein n=1 Tax=Leptospira ainazelensis TaxID=2810034 RepID=UPI0019631895|nr:ketoacyl-ACP synthase III [Leptospira ainazelensis]MBM9499648.1 ketoacyl-ACP synthase III [Leptospira ainazelensis]
MKTSSWGIRIQGTGRYLPGPPVSNLELISYSGLNTSDDWIVSNLGIRQRHWAPEGIATSHIAAEASFIALEEANIPSGDLDRIILCTSTGDWTSPAAASKVQSLIGATCPAEDKQVACSGFLFGLDHAARLIYSGERNVLVIGADVKSRFVRKNDLRLFPIFGDGAGAVILSKGKPGEGLIASKLWTDGSKSEHLYTPAGGSAMPASMESVRNDLHSTIMQVEGKIIFDDAISIMTLMSQKICEEAGLSLDEIDVFIPHQANIRIMSSVAKNLRISPEKVITTIDHTGNIVAGTIPYALDFARKQGRIKPGHKILFVCAGAGYSAAAAIYIEPAI